MSKAAKDVVHDTLNIEMVDNYNCLSCGHHQPESLVSKALRVVAALTKAGWLREEPRVGPCGEGAIKRLTRERDEARRDCAQAVGQLDFAQRQRDAALASAASPEVMRVLKAVERLRNHWNKQDDWNAVNEFHAAADALSASRQPKAQEPRYEARGHEVWDTLGRGPIKARKVAAFSCMDDVEGAAREFAARLNGEGGAS